MHHLADAHRTRQLSTSELRSNFLVDGLFRLGEVTLRHIDLDRVVLGGAVPLGDPLLLDAPASLAAEYFAERREIGILNIAARGTITVDGHRYAMDCQDVLYVSRGSKEIILMELVKSMGQHRAPWGSIADSERMTRKREKTFHQNSPSILPGVKKAGAVWGR